MRFLGLAMTEDQWQACTNPNEMLLFLERETSERKLRFFAVACCRRIWDLVGDERSRKAIELAERFADGLASGEELAMAHRAASEVLAEAGEEGPIDSAAMAAMQASGHWRPYKANNSAALVRPLVTDPKSREIGPRHKAAVMAEWAVQANLLRDIFGNPFRRPHFDPTWQTSSVVRLAKAIYEERAFDQLPLLAEGLEEAGCTNADILAHCRQPGLHFRGCWVMDLILGKG